MKILEAVKDKKGLVLRIGLAALLVAMAAATAVLYFQYHRNQAQASARSDVSAAAADSVAKLLSYKADTVDDDIARSIDLLTGSFAADYRKLADETVAPSAKEKKINTEATAVATGVIDASTSHATVLVFINQSTTSATTQEPTMSPSRARLTMDRVDGRWLISGLEPV